MGNVEKELAQAILAAADLDATKLGLRFDRVVLRVLDELRRFAEAAAPKDVAVLVAITAPIRRPSKTAADLRREIGEMLSARGSGAERTATLRGNLTRLRLVEGVPERSPRLIGFVHNRGATAEPLFDLAERWLWRGST